jgi:hypothetical protein
MKGNPWHRDADINQRTVVKTLGKDIRITPFSSSYFDNLRACDVIMQSPTFFPESKEPTKGD